METPTTGNPQAEDAAVATEERARYVRGRRAAVAGIGLNLLLAVAKGILAVLTQSVALMADTVHTASDSATSIVVWIGLRVARRPADEQHPHGHGRAETIAALIVAVLLGVAGVDFGVKSIHRMANPPEIGGEFGGALLLWSAGFILLTVGVKAWMGFYASRVGSEIGNQSLEADAWHHHSDALSSLLVVAALVLARFGVYGADAVLGLGVSAVILYTAWHHLRRSSSSLLGERPPGGLVAEVKRLAGGVHGVTDVHGVEIHDYGRRKVASLHITLLAGLSLDEAHRVASEVESVLAGELHLGTSVHAEPQGDEITRQRLDRVRSTVDRVLRRHPGVVSFHALSLHVEPHGLEAEFNVHVPPQTPVGETHRLEHNLRELLTRELDDLHVHVHIEPCPLQCPACPETCGVELRPAEQQQ